jgi:hypothetical protein
MQSYFLESDNDMKLSKGDKTWFSAEIARQISEAISDLKPHGWRKVVFHLRQLGPLIAVVAVVVSTVIALLSITLGAVYQSFAHVKEETEFRTNTKDKLDKFDADLVSMRALISSIQPLKSQNQKAAQELLTQARQKLVPPIPATVIEQAGMSFIEAAEKEPSAWGTALDFLNYRSTLNVYTRPARTVSLPNDVRARFNIPGVAGKALAQLSENPTTVESKDAARYEEIGKNLNQQEQFGIAQLIVSTGAVDLDNTFIRHVVFVGVEIHFSGKALTLQDVVFSDCTFVFENAQPARKLGQIVLASSPVTFENAG